MSLDATDLATYSAIQVASLADVDRWAVRDEGFRRQAKAEKMLARAEKLRKEAEKLMKEAQMVIAAARAAE
jgi:cell division protein FtsB